MARRAVRLRRVPALALGELAEARGNLGEQVSGLERAERLLDDEQRLLGLRGLRQGDVQVEHRLHRAASERAVGDEERIGGLADLLDAGARFELEARGL